MAPILSILGKPSDPVECHCALLRKAQVHRCIPRPAIYKGGQKSLKHVTVPIEIDLVVLLNGFAGDLPERCRLVHHGGHCG